VYFELKIIVISDIHGDVENLLSFLDKMKELTPDVIVCPGDFTDVNIPKGFSQEEIAKLIITELKTVKVPILAVPGNVDVKGVIDVLEKENVSIHGRGKIIGEFGFYGYGGAKTPFETSIEPSEEELRLGLTGAWKDVTSAKYKIQVTHAPPEGTRLDLIQSGIHVGSNTVRSFIELNTPLVAISAHIHEARCVDKINNTFLINSGKFPEGYFGLINIKNGTVEGRILNMLE
jgi:hypothetical protein